MNPAGLLLGQDQDSRLNPQALLRAVVWPRPVGRGVKMSKISCTGLDRHAYTCPTWKSLLPLWAFPRI